jgi:hypothetical protein
MAKEATRSGFESREIEEVGGITYVGKSIIGESETSTDKWIIQRIEVVGDLTSIKFAEGTWATRAALNYL